MSFAPPPPPSMPPPGWYPEPERPGIAQRYWNGRSWEPAWQPIPRHDGLPEIGPWLGRAFSSMWRRWPALLGIGLVTGVPAGILVSFGLRYLFRDVLVIDEEVVGWDSSRLWAASVMFLLATFLGVLAALAANWLMLREFDAPSTASSGTSPTIDDGARAVGPALFAAIRALPRAIGWTIVLVAGSLAAVLALVVVFVIAWPLGVLVLLALIPVGFWLVIRWAFLVQAIVDRPGNPFSRSMRVSKGRFWPVCGRVLLMLVITWGMSIAGNVIVSAAGGTGFGSQVELDDDVFDLGAAVGPSILSIVATAVVTAVSAVVVTGTIAAAFAELYRTRHPARSST